MNDAPRDELDRLFLRLVRAVRDARPEYLSRSFEVAELLAFVPYRAVRTELGVETNDDYAHVVTRLLAGERGYLFADDLMQDDLGAELASPNPDLAAYRAYLNARVTLSQEHARRALEAIGPPGGEADDAGEPAPTPPPKAPPQAVRQLANTVAIPRPFIPPRPSATPRPLDPEADAPRRAARPGCRYCGQQLPEGRDVQFCPHCGQNLRVRRCGACSAELEPAWKFCVACGRASSA